MKVVIEDHIDAMARGAASDYLRLAKNSVTSRKAIVVVFTYALRAALDDLSPEERAEWMKLAIAEVQR